MPDRAQIAILESDANIAHDVQIALESDGHYVHPVESTARLESYIKDHHTDLVIVDDEIVSDKKQRIDIVELTGRLHENTNLGIMFLSDNNDSALRINALKAGADAVVPKPIEPLEIVARVAAIIRRLSKKNNTDSASLFPEQVLSIGKSKLNVVTRKLISPDGRRHRITDKELALLRLFLANPNRILSRDELAEFAKGRPWSPFDRSLDVCISRLRRKIEQEPERPKLIETVRGAGYRFTPKS